MPKLDIIKIKRVYEKPQRNDGKRILVDRLWPRGVSKENAKLDLWLKEIAPTDSLRKWFSHDPAKWEQFRKLYFKELETKKEKINIIKELQKNGVVTLLFGAKDTKRNNAVVLAEFIRLEQGGKI